MAKQEYIEKNKARLAAKAQEPGVKPLYGGIYFYVTRIGCGIAGFTDEEIAPLFDEAYDLYNVRIPKSFAYIIECNRKNRI